LGIDHAVLPMKMFDVMLISITFAPLLNDLRH